MKNLGKVLMLGVLVLVLFGCVSEKSTTTNDVVEAVVNGGGITSSEEKQSYDAVILSKKEEYRTKREFSQEHAVSQKLTVSSDSDINTSISKSVVIKDEMDIEGSFSIPGFEFTVNAVEQKPDRVKFAYDLKYYKNIGEINFFHLYFEDIEIFYYLEDGERIDISTSLLPREDDLDGTFSLEELIEYYLAEDDEIMLEDIDEPASYIEAKGEFYVFFDQFIPDEINSVHFSAEAEAFVGLKSILEISVDSKDPVNEFAKHVLVGTESSELVSWTVNAKHEALTGNDIRIISSDSNFANYVSEIILYGEDKLTELGREVVTDNIVEFDNVNVDLPKGTSKIYGKVISHKIGQDQLGSQSEDMILRIEFTDVESADSGSKIVSDDIIYKSSESMPFRIVPAKISAVSFVQSYGGYSVAEKLHNGENNIAILAFTVDSNNNTNLNGSNIVPDLKNIQLGIYKQAGSDQTDSLIVNSLTIKKISAETTGELQITSGELNEFEKYYGEANFNLEAIDSEIENNVSTVYFLIKADVKLATDDFNYIEVICDGLYNGSITYSGGYGDIPEIRIGVDRIVAPTIFD